MRLDERFTPLATLLLASSLFLTACGGDPAEPDDGSQPDAGVDGSPAAQCGSASSCPSIACHCGDGATISHQGCKKGVCDGASVCATVCQGHGAATDGGASGTDAGTANACDDDFRTGKNSTVGSDVYKACNSNPAKGQSMPTNCASGHFILFDKTQQCFCMLNCDDDFATPIAAGKACTKDGTYLCRKVKNKAGSVNNLCLPPSWDQALCKAP